jgi:hypothetical protein
MSSREFLADNICINENSGMEVNNTLTKKTKIKQNHQIKSEFVCENSVLLN